MSGIQLLYDEIVKTHRQRSGIRLRACDLDGAVLERGQTSAPEQCGVLQGAVVTRVGWATATGRPLEQDADWGIEDEDWCLTDLAEYCRRQRRRRPYWLAARLGPRRDAHAY